MSNSNHLIDIKLPAMMAGGSIAASAGGGYVMEAQQWIDTYAQLVTFSLTVAGAIIPLLFVMWQWRRAWVKAKREDARWRMKNDHHSHH